MINVTYEVGLYQGKEWAVLCSPMNVWYFTKSKTYEDAKRLEKELREETI